MMASDIQTGISVCLEQLLKRLNGAMLSNVLIEKVVDLSKLVGGQSEGLVKLLLCLLFNVRY